MSPWWNPFPRRGEMELSDEELMTHLKEGDEGSFEHLVRKYYAYVLNFAYRIFEDRDLAEDIAQETFLRLWRYRQNYPPSATFRTSLYRIAKNLCLNELRRSPHELKGDVKDEGEPGECMDLAPPKHESMADDLERRIRDGLRSLPEEQRLVIILKVYQGLSYKEAAEIMGCPVGTVASRKNMALKKLRDLLKQSPCRG